ncbi:hypothetical protein E4J89_04090 [Arthrobacter sp. CAU 1506]|uniref:DUF6297 family protein n=1 Tax=Arthrobacter sp. CAU 1506 TaxID=2560052 RepID=UPI0010ACD449|nr:DUF6297 family protein [Arthrobacter sp. CAU 1506]TJY71435.1 hypothetical protein E4J89_04090 [Arthrobacter sp. CAU 1506]
MSQLPSAAGTAGAVRFNPMAFSRAAAARHPLESRWSVFADVYQTLLGAVVLISYAGALLYGIREELLVNAGSVLTRSVISERFAQVPAQTAMAAVLLLAASGGFLLLLRLGPVSATAAQGYWWLGLPINRRRALARPAAGRMLRTALVAGLVFLPLAALAGPAHGAASVLLGSAAAAAVGAALYLAAAFAQATAGKPAATRVAGIASAVGLVVLLLPLLSGGLASFPGQALLLLPSGWPLLVVHGSIWPLWAAAALVLVGGCSGYFLLRSLSTAELTASGSVSGHAAGALYFGDFRELERALDHRRVRRRFRLSLAPPSSPSAVLVRADVVAFLRSPGKVRHVAVMALAPAAVGCIAGAGSAIIMAGVLLGCGWAAASGCAFVARAHAARPVLESLLPLAPVQARRAHAVLPAVGLAVWGLVSFGLLAVMGAGGPSLAVLGVLAGLGLAGAAMRAAFQPRPDWTRPGGSTSNLLMPAGVEASFIRGPDFSVIAMLPALIAVVSGVVPWWLLLVQAGSSAYCLWWGTRAE